MEGKQLQSSEPSANEAARTQNQYLVSICPLVAQRYIGPFRPGNVVISSVFLFHGPRYHALFFRQTLRFLSADRLLAFV